MDESADTASGVTRRYFDFDGEPGRLHRDSDGDLTADVYRSGKGHVKVDPTAMLYNSYEIDEARYKELVLQATGRGKRTEQD